VVCGRAELMEYAEGARRLTGDYVSLTGTYSGNPVSCSAALAVLEILREPGAYERLFARGERLRAAVREAFEAVDVPVQVIGEPTAFEPWFCAHEIRDFRDAQRADALLGQRFAQALLERGVLKGHEKFFVSTAHSDADIDRTIDAVRDAAAELARRR
jgi:glutamate-1-semialdehyde 2,1-aminomutase